MANDLGTQIIDFLTKDEVGVILLAFMITTVAKVVWRRRLADMFGEQLESKKYIVFGIFTGLGILLWIVGESYLVRAFGLCMIGFSLASMFGEAWEDFIYPFIQTNTWRVGLTGLGIILFLFAGTIEEVLDFPALIIIIISIIMIVGVWFGTINRGYKGIQTRYPSVNVKETIRKYM